MKKLILLIFVVAASLNAQSVQGQIGQVPVVAAADNSPVGGAGNLTTVGSVPYVSASGILNQDAGQFFWDATNNRLGIGTATPAGKLDVTGASSATPSNLLNLTQDYTGGSGGAAFNGIVQNFTGTLPNVQAKFIEMQNNGVTKFSVSANNGSTSMFFKRISTTAGYTFQTGGANLDNLQIYGTNNANPFTIAPAGNVGIFDIAPATMLSVVGNAQIGFASGQTGPANGLIVSGNVGIGTTLPVYGLDVAKSGASGTARFYDQTASTGSTLAVFRAGVAQSGNVLEVQNNAGTVIASVGSTGNLYSSNALSVGATFSVVTLYSPSDGVLRFTDNAGTSFNRLQLGGTTSSFPSIKRNGTALVIRLADDSANAAIQASSYISNDGTAGATVTTCTGFKNGLCISGM